MDAAHGVLESAALDDHGEELDAIFLGAVEDDAVEPFALGVVGLGEDVEQRQGELALGEVGADGLAGRALGADKVEAVVVNLVGDAEMSP